MALRTHITDPGSGQEARVHKPVNLGFENPAGAVVYTERRKTFEPLVQFFAADSGAIDMAIDGSTGGTPENIHDGEDTSYWTASALSGTWDFSSATQANDGTQSIDATGTVNNDEALFEDGTSISMSTYTSLGGAVYITSWPGTGTKEVEIEARLNGVVVGNSVNLSSYVTTGTQNVWQTFTIPKADMGLTSDTVDELVIRTIDIGGGEPPNYFLDSLLWNEAAGGTATEYAVRAQQGTNRFATGFSIFMADTVTEAAATAYDTILGVPALSNGILFTRQSGQRILFSSPLRQLSDFIQSYGGGTFTTGGDGTNRWIKIESAFDPPIRLREDDYMSMVVRDDLSGLLVLRASLRVIDEVFNE